MPSLTVIVGATVGSVGCVQCGPCRWGLPTALFEGRMTGRAFSLVLHVSPYVIQYFRGKAVQEMRSTIDRSLSWWILNKMPADILFQSLSIWSDLTSPTSDDGRLQRHVQKANSTPSNAQSVLCILRSVVVK